MADDRKWIGEGDSGGEIERHHRWTGRQITAIAILVVLVVFVLQNAHSASLTLFVTTISFPLWLILAATAFLGFSAGWLFGRGRRSRRD
jgi:uncharacterized integral membrane protein